MAHVQLRLERLEPMSAILNQALEPHQAESVAATTNRLLEAQAELDEIAEANDETNRRHVEQTSMSAGEIDLF